MGVGPSDSIVNRWHSLIELGALQDRHPSRTIYLPEIDSNGDGYWYRPQGALPLSVSWLTMIGKRLFNFSPIHFSLENVCPNSPC